MSQQTSYIDSKGNLFPADENERCVAENTLRALQWARKTAVEKRRLARIAQFEQQQLSRRDWISFAEIIDWRSRDRDDGSLNEEKMRAVRDDLSTEISSGNAFFDQNKSLILITSPLYRVSRTLLSDPWRLRDEAWLTNERWGYWRAGQARDQILDCCWIPLAACLQWASNVPFEPKPVWTERVHGASPTECAPSLDKPVKLVGNQIAAEFERWRNVENAGKEIPSFQDDFSHMRKFGVTRNAVVKLREEYPTRGVGDKKSKSNRPKS